MANKINKELSIQVNLNGLSFCILNRSNSIVEYINTIAFEDKLNPFDTLHKLKEELASNTIFSDEFSAITILHYNELSTLVPKPLYDEAHNAEYLKFNTKILKTDFIASDNLKSQDIVSVYVPYININNYIFDTFGTFTYKHASSVFIDALYHQNKTIEDGVYINVEQQSIQVVIIKNKCVSLYNHFEFTTPEDFIYYVLFTYEQKQLDTETVKLKLFGSISKDDDLFAIAYKYIRHVELKDDAQDFLIKHSF